MSKQVEILQPHSSFPGKVRGDIIENPTKEQLDIAEKSNCTHVFESEEKTSVKPAEKS